MIIERALLATPAELGEAVAARLAARAQEPLTVALTGGSAAKLVHPPLARAGVDWARVTLFFGDERAVPPDHADSNFRLARETLLDAAGVPAARVHRMRGEAADLAAAAREYEALLPPALDIVLLGMGPDGHVCSLFPGHALLGERARLVGVVEDSPKPPPRRLSLTMPALAAAREVWFVLAGADKAAPARALADPASELPGPQVARAATTRVFLDRAAGE